MVEENMKYLEHLIGRTPMLELAFDYKGEERAATREKPRGSHRLAR